MIRRFSCVLLAFVIGCGGDGERSLQVTVRTDFAPLIDFSTVRVEVGSLFEERSVTSEQDYIRGVVAAEFPDVTGPVSVKATLLNAAGTPIITRTLDTRVRGRATVPLTLTRACRNVECPNSADSAATECDNGRCVVPGCSFDSPELCDDSVCLEASDCPEVLESCGEVVCLGGACLFTTIEGEEGCSERELCVPGSGCVLQPDSDPPDMQMPDVGMDVDMTTCEEGAPCEIEGAACEEGVTECSTGEAVCVSAGVKEAGVPCRDAMGECDAPEVCDGTAPTCPEDAAQPVGTACGVDGSQFCNGQACGACQPGAACVVEGEPCAMGSVVCADDGTPSCEATGFVAAGTECRAAAGPCDVAESCTGSAGACPADGFVGAGSECRASAGVCDAAETCLGDGPACPADAFSAAGTECRTSAGPCDVPETCTGSGASCPLDAFAPGSLICRGQNGVCDVAESCTGSSAACPSDGFAPGSTECRASAGPCDVAETCTGSSSACPSDSVRGSSFECRPSAGACDVAENCDGSVTCPADAAAPDGTSCGAGQFCNGFNCTSCNPGAPCTVTGQPCATGTTVCAGDGTPSCMPSGFVAAGTQCRASAGPCDVVESCTGASGTCPADNFRPSSFTCRSASGACDVAETCTGSGAACPGDGFASSATVCRAQNGTCDVAETCTGFSRDCPGDSFRSSGFTCRAQNGDCDVAETCTGSSRSCPSNAFRSSATQCRASAGVCDVAETCTGTSANCPTNTFASSSTTCRGSA
ncbi:MAG: hypothetical protein AAF411_28505, partial [Myxococcota bacterium]